MTSPTMMADASQAGARTQSSSSQDRVAVVKGRPTEKVIVLMKNTLPSISATSQRRSEAVAAVTAPVLDAVRRSGAERIRTFHILDGFAAKVSRGEAAALRADPAVAHVLPDARISAPSNTLAPPVQSTRTAGSGRAPVDGVCNSASKTKAQLNPQATVLTHSDSDVKGAKTARSLGYTGKGVKVGLIAEGIDVDNPEFIRPNGTHVITDYRDFSGDGTNAATDGDEMFLDATSVAAQGARTYNVQNFSALPLNRPCKIRIEGVAPGASLAAMKIFNVDDGNTFSNALEGIDWAVSVDHVNIMNESYGSLSYPDVDHVALEELNNQIIKAGVTVVASSGDSGVTNTIWSPSTDPALISVGATTAYRFDLQTGYAFAAGSHATGYVDNNISSLSSGGVSQTGRAVDLVAPGELDFGACTASSQYYGCVNYAGQPSNVEAIGGTSQAGPVVAGAAALVIQAYRRYHDGKTPSPAVVKQILTSTADDIDAPTTQQGAGLVDSYKAVLAAESYPGTTKGRHGATLLTSTDRVDVAAAPGTHFARSVKITNNGAVRQNVKIASRTLGAYRQVAQATTTLSDTDSPHAIDFQGLPDNVEKIKFTVPAGMNRLDARIAWQGASSSLTARVRLTLIDPRNRLVGYSLPQGIGNYGDSQVASPTPGVWTAYITSRTTANGGTTGPVVFGAYVARWTTLGHVSPSVLHLAPGQSKRVTFRSAVPARPGDTSTSLVLTSSAGAPSRVTTVPVVIRSQASFTAKRRSFTDTITGPNGRSYASSVGRFYDMKVSKGTHEINVNLREGASGNPFLALLVDPNGNAQGSASSDVVTSTDGNAQARAGQLHVLNPTPGLWRLVIDFGPVVSGKSLSMRYTISYDTTEVHASAPGLPSAASTSLQSGKAVTVPVTVHNTGAGPESVFIDARGTTATTYVLTQSAPSMALPNGAGSASAILIPTHTTRMTDTVSSSLPVTFDTSWSTGFPDYAAPRAKTSRLHVTSSPVAPGDWFILPQSVGPFGTKPGPSGTASVSTVIRTLPFDSDVTSPTGDQWLQSIDADATLTPVVIPSGGSATIPVTITPSGTAGTVVHGTLFVDQAVNGATPYGAGTSGSDANTQGNEVTALPYTYTVGAASSAGR